MRNPTAHRFLSDGTSGLAFGRGRRDAHACADERRNLQFGRRELARGRAEEAAARTQLGCSFERPRPTGLGVGMALLTDAQKIRPPLVKPIKMRPHFDGFVVDR